MVLKNIITTTEKCGLRKRNLKKHKKDVEKFYIHLGKSHFESEVASKLAKRFFKCKEQLFTFLDYDGIPWNNNNAEHAFKHFATYRRNVNGIFTKEGIKRYLILLSIYETCRYRNINFFKFLLSQEKFLNIYINKYTRAGNLRKGCKPHRSIY